MTPSTRILNAERSFVEHEHRDLRPGIDRIHDVARAVGTMAAPDLSIVLLDVLDWVDRIVEPHAAWEDTWLYPEFDRRAGTPWATRLMRFEHHQIRTAASRLETDRETLRHEPNHDQACEARPAPRGARDVATVACRTRGAVPVPVAGRGAARPGLSD